MALGKLGAIAASCLIALCGAAVAAPLPAEASSLRWTRFVDPAELAFSVDVPQDWRSEGGIHRVSALQPIPWLRSRSPDGRTLIVLGDPNMVGFVIPTPISDMANMPEGTTYNAGGVLLTILHYQPGQEFAEAYGSRYLPSLCAGVRLEDSRPRPDASYALAGVLGFIRVEAGEARFACTGNGEPLEAYLFSVTLLYGDQNGLGLWEGNRLFGFLAPRDLAPAASDMLVHMAQSFAFDPVWVARTSKSAADISVTATRVNAQVSKSIMQSWSERRAAQERGLEEYSRMQRGIDVYANPATGTSVTVPGGSNYYWIDAQGRVIGTQTDTVPGPGFIRMVRVPPG